MQPVQWFCSGTEPDVASLQLLDDVAAALSSQNLPDTYAATDQLEGHLAQQATDVAAAIRAHFSAQVTEQVQRLRAQIDDAQQSSASALEQQDLHAASEALMQLRSAAEEFAASVQGAHAGFQTFCDGNRQMQCRSKSTLAARASLLCFATMHVAYDAATAPNASVPAARGDCARSQCNSFACTP